jgi:guanylate cyclase
MYDAVTVYARAVHAVLAKGGDPRDGAAVIRAAIEMGSYPSDLQGDNVRMDAHGDSEGHYMALAMVEDTSLCPNTGTSMLKVGDFIHEDDDFLVFSPDQEAVKRIAWPGGAPPANEPPCGFDNERCRLRLDPFLVSGLVLLLSMAAIGMSFVWR